MAGEEEQGGKRRKQGNVEGDKGEEYEGEKIVQMGEKRTGHQVTRILTHTALTYRQ